MGALLRMRWRILVCCLPVVAWGFVSCSTRPAAVNRPGDAHPATGKPVTRTLAKDSPGRDGPPYGEQKKLAEEGHLKLHSVHLWAPSLFDHRTWLIARDGVPVVSVSSGEAETDAEDQPRVTIFEGRAQKVVVKLSADYAEVQEIQLWEASGPLAEDFVTKTDLDADGTMDMRVVPERGVDIRVDDGWLPVDRKVEGGYEATVDGAQAVFEFRNGNWKRSRPSGGRSVE